MFETTFFKMTPIFRIIKIFLLTCIALLSANFARASTLARGEGDAGHLVVGIELKGAQRTDEDWLVQYLGLEKPRVVAEQELRDFERKLLTTAVFTGVRAEFKDAAGTPAGNKIIVFSLDEKWTTIPVVRGAFGGGTPLTVLGVYDTHSFGKLWTLGAESRKYGDAPPGFVIWARAPRWLRGEHQIGIELWRDFRVRTLYDADDEKFATINTDAQRLRLMYLAPVAHLPGWQAGLDLKISQDAPSAYREEPNRRSATEPKQKIVLSAAKEFLASPMLRVIFDDIAVDNVDHDGVRLLMAAGPQLGGDTGGRGEIEVFYYKLLPAQLNLAAHAFAAQAQGSALASQYFLGGLDSIRGIPDGAVFGNHAAYANFEMRHLSYKWRHAWLQTVTFLDLGSAGAGWLEAKHAARSAVGAGVRISIPKVYRLSFRVDYAWSIDGSGSHGITAGLNELFQPHPPL